MGAAPVTQPPLSFRSGSSMGLEVFGISGARTAPGTGRRVRLAPPGDPAVTSWWWREPGDTSAPLRSGSTGLLASLTLSQTGGARSPGGELRLRKACFILRDSAREALAGPPGCVLARPSRARESIWWDLHVALF